MTSPQPDRPRIAPLPPDERDERTEEVLSGLRGGPGGGELNIFTTLARHPKLLKQWSRFGGTLLYGGELPHRERELLILRTALLCRATYEWGQHVRIARDAGITDDEIARVAQGPDAPGWDPFDAALVRAVDELHHEACLSDATWEQLAERYDERALIELCMVVGQYHLVAFTLNSLGVQTEPGVEGLPA
jgi:alkylhydroperoxidase family enzyme